uniref:hypothetical protein n=1 Tax=Bradyrhizobium sp. (strain ORS 278) TaxID=114615 RepID=UPI0002F9B74C|nr:hypothetical protein [Bradyrhizobium sp. ORS 278]
MASAEYSSPNGKTVASGTSMDSLLSDDFGGSAINATVWDVIDGGLPAVVANVAVSALQSAPVATFSQAKIGSGIAGITDSVSASGLTVNMGTTTGAERWYLSRQIFAGKEDILVILSKSQVVAGNSIYIGLCEVDPASGIPLLNPNFAADGNGSMEFTNRGGAEFGLSGTNTAFQAEAIGDSSSTKAVGNAGAAGAAWTTAQECLIEIDSRDITVSTASVDSVAAKASGGSRVSSQCPNDKRLYKLVMRFRNPTAPGSATSVTVQRVLVVDNYEQRVQISTGEGDQLASKAVAVNVVTAASTPVTVNQNIQAAHKLTSAATTNATLVKAGQTLIWGGLVMNTVAAVRYLKFYNKATAPVVGTDTPVLTIPLPQNVPISLLDLVGSWSWKATLGLGYAITGAPADNDTTAVGAGDVMVNIIYQ